MSTEEAEGGNEQSIFETPTETEAAAATTDLPFQPAQFTSTELHLEDVKIVSDGFNGGFNAPPAPKMVEEEPQGWHRFYKISFYQPYFNMNTQDILFRCYSGLQPFGKNFFDRISPYPDFYGPFWVATTLIVSLVACSSISSRAEHWHLGCPTEWAFDFAKVSVASWFIYPYLSLCSLGLYISQRYYNVGLSLPELMCLYGYSLTGYIPAALASILPFSWLQWMVFILGACVATVSLVWSLFPSISKLEWKKALLLLLIPGALQFLIGLFFKAYFFGKTTCPQLS
ncbi:protein YIPF1/2 [Pelomyxa schiedti]|nr:protein YIPF1/2 [Pelomyxa schiedti]